MSIDSYGQVEEQTASNTVTQAPQHGTDQSLEKKATDKAVTSPNKPSSVEDIIKQIKDEKETGNATEFSGIGGDAINVNGGATFDQHVFFNNMRIQKNYWKTLNY